MKPARVSIYTLALLVASSFTSTTTLGQSTDSLPTSTTQFVPLISDAPASTSVTAVDTTPAVSPPNGAQSSATCTEHVPSGKERPLVEEQFPERGLSGHAVPLVLKITHGKGERVLDDSFEFQAGSDGASALRRAGFEFPTKGSPAVPKVLRTEDANNATTTVTLNVIPLPGKSGPQSLTLPPLPVAIARPSGEIMTLCSASHALAVDDPTANIPNAMPKRHPGALRQQELWLLLRNLVYGALVGIALAGLLALLFRWYKRRPRALPPPPPPRPAWEIALEELQDIRHADLVRQGRLTAHLERVNNTLRAYLGRTYNFDGLESTTEEALRALRGTSLPQKLYTQVEAMLRDSDLVKFAKIQPTEAQCHGAVDDVEQVVKQTMHEENKPSNSLTPTAAASAEANVISTAAAVLRSRESGAAKTPSEAPLGSTPAAHKQEDE